MKINMTIEIPDGDYCRECRFCSLNANVNAICTLYDRVELQDACDFYRNQNHIEDCKNILCCKCPADEIIGYAKCEACRNIKSVLEKVINPKNNKEPERKN